MFDCSGIQTKTQSIFHTVFIFGLHSHCSVYKGVHCGLPIIFIIQCLYECLRDHKRLNGWPSHQFKLNLIEQRYSVVFEGRSWYRNQLSASIAAFCSGKMSPTTFKFTHRNSHIHQTWGEPSIWWKKKPLQQCKSNKSQANV